MAEVNSNRIVRVKNDTLHDLLDWCASYVDAPYQIVFEEWVKLMMNGYAHGTHTNVVLCDKVKERLGK